MTAARIRKLHRKVQDTSAGQAVQAGNASMTAMGKYQNMIGDLGRIAHVTQKVAPKGGSTGIRERVGVNDMFNKIAGRRARRDIAQMRKNGVATPNMGSIGSVGTLAEAAKY